MLFFPVLLESATNVNATLPEHRSHGCTIVRPAVPPHYDERYAEARDPDGSDQEISVRVVKMKTRSVQSIEAVCNQGMRMKDGRR